MIKICLFERHLTELDKLSACCHGYTFTIVTNKSSTSVRLLDLYTKSQLHNTHNT